MHCRDAEKTLSDEYDNAVENAINESAELVAKITQLKLVTPQFTMAYFMKP